MGNILCLLKLSIVRVDKEGENRIRNKKTAIFKKGRELFPLSCHLFQWVAQGQYLLKEYA